MAQDTQKRCEYCDGTGIVHRLDGEFLGECPDCVENLPREYEKDTDESRVR